MAKQDLNDLLALLDNSVSIEDGKVAVKDAARLRATIHRLAADRAQKAFPAGERPGTGDSLRVTGSRLHRRSSY